MVLTFRRLSSLLCCFAFSARSCQASVLQSPLSRKRKAINKQQHYHDALSFLFDDVCSAQQDMTNQQQLPSTRIRALADKFVNVHLDDRIDLVALLEACRFFAIAMVDVGQNLSARDMRKNVAKAETFLQHQQQPTDMRSVLQAEQRLGVHSYENDMLIRLGEESCAMGLLWIRRSLEFQFHMFEQLVHGLDPEVASQFAYENSLRDFHGWALQKVYTVALKANSGTNAGWIARIGGFDDGVEDTSLVANPCSEQFQAARRDLHYLLDVWRPLLGEWGSIYRELNIDEKRRV